ncbi:MAG: transcription termination/antitermination protein NusG [Terriglobales bacterium]
MSSAIQSHASLAGTLPLELPQFPLWYAVRARVRCEKKIDTALRHSGITTFLPLVEEVHRWSDRRKTIEVPLFSSYVFVRIVPSAASRLTVLQTPGVVGFVGNSRGAAPIPEHEIEQVRSVIERRVPFGPSPYLKVGQRVRVRGGALDGMEGVLSSYKSRTTLIISVELIQRSISVSVEGYDIEPA